MRKSLLPTYDVFDEWRYFEPAAEVAPVALPRARRLGVSICEDIWNDADFWPHRLYRADPIEALVQRRRGAHRQRLGLALHDREAPPAPAHAGRDGARWRRPLLFVNQVGGQDDLVFDGASLAFDAARPA